MACSTKSFSIIAAACLNNGIGFQGQLPWRLKKEMKYFTDITSTCASGKQNAVIMGRKTWQSIPYKFRPLPNRVNVVLSTSIDRIPDNVFLFRSLAESLTCLTKDDHIDQIFVIGGAALYREAIAMSACTRVYLTRIDHHFECDTFFPQVDLDKYKPIQLPEVPLGEQEEGGIRYKYFVYERI